MVTLEGGALTLPAGAHTGVEGQVPAALGVAPPAARDVAGGVEGVGDAVDLLDLVGDGGAVSVEIPPALRGTVPRAGGLSGRLLLRGCGGLRRRGVGGRGLRDLRGPGLSGWELGGRVCGGLACAQGEGQQRDSREREARRDLVISCSCGGEGNRKLRNGGVPRAPAGPTPEGRFVGDSFGALKLCRTLSRALTLHLGTRYRGLDAGIRVATVDAQVGVAVGCDKGEAS